MSEQHGFCILGDAFLYRTKRRYARDAVQFDNFGRSDGEGTGDNVDTRPCLLNEDAASGMKAETLTRIDQSVQPARSEEVLTLDCPLSVQNGHNGVFFKLSCVRDRGSINVTGFVFSCRKEVTGPCLVIMHPKSSPPSRKVLCNFKTMTGAKIGTESRYLFKTMFDEPVTLRAHEGPVWFLVWAYPATICYSGKDRAISDSSLKYEPADPCLSVNENSLTQSTFGARTLGGCVLYKKRYLQGYNDSSLYLRFHALALCSRAKPVIRKRKDDDALDLFTVSELFGSSSLLCGCANVICTILAFAFDVGDDPETPSHRKRLGIYWNLAAGVRGIDSTRGGTKEEE